MVRKIGHRLERAISTSSERGLGHLRAHGFEYIVIDSKMVNAFAAPGGKICVFTGLIKLCDNEDELAAVVSYGFSQTRSYVIRLYILFKF